MKGDLVKMAIKISGKTQQQAADIIGIDRVTLNKLLNSEVPQEYVVILKKKGIDFDNLNYSNENLELKYLKQQISFLLKQNENLFKLLNKKK